MVEKKNSEIGYKPAVNPRGYQPKSSPNGGGITGGYQPEKSQGDNPANKPPNPPPKKP